MQPFITEDFLLQNDTAKLLFHQHARNMPVIDFHNHLDARAIYDDYCYHDLTEAWLAHDHYKWRAMRANGISEAYITGTADSYEKFKAWADTVSRCIGNPLYHWSHLELKRYFGIDETLSPSNAEAVWKLCKEKLNTPAYSIRNLLQMQHVEVLCTTDDPVFDLPWHRRLKEDGFEIQVLPTFRPERALNLESPDYLSYIEELGQKVDTPLLHLDELINALLKRLDYFVDCGCRASDHSLENQFYLPSSYEEADRIYQKKRSGGAITPEETARYRGFLLTRLGTEYARRGLAMQLHIGALRNNSSRMYRILGSDSGYDSLNDFSYAGPLAALLDKMEQENLLPKTILYYLNPKDADMLSAMAGNFQGNEEGIRGKIQLGSAWWFCDHKNGMNRQMDALADTGLFSSFIGMLTDSRSFLSFSRHEYFRRILCQKVGCLVENGEYPRDLPYLGTMIEDICYYNAKSYFSL